MSAREQFENKVNIPCLVDNALYSKTYKQACRYPACVREQVENNENTPLPFSENTYDNKQDKLVCRCLASVLEQFENKVNIPRLVYNTCYSKTYKQACHYPAYTQEQVENNDNIA